MDKICNGEPTCPNGEDEIDCENSKCLPLCYDKASQYSTCRNCYLSVKDMVFEHAYMNVCVCVCMCVCIVYTNVKFELCLSIYPSHNILAVLCREHAMTIHFIIGRM